MSHLLKSNPGGQIAPADVIGRDAYIARLWSILRNQSLVLTAERRVGKTCVVRKMQEESPPGFLCTYHDLEGLATPLDFVEAVFHDIEHYLGRLRKLAVKTRLSIANLAGAEMSGVRLPEALAPHWPRVLSVLLEDFAEHADHNLLVCFWDEFPLMLQNVIRSGCSGDAMQLLDVLRSLRQTKAPLRMVFTGSIGLQHVLSELKRDGYTNEPVNDTWRETLPPLDESAAEDLAARLLVGDGVPCSDPQAVAHAIAAATDGVPYYIHHIVHSLGLRSSSVAPSDVADTVASGLTNANDAWDMRHYRSRMDHYYNDGDRPVALAILDVLATVDIPLPFADLLNRTKSAKVIHDDEAFRRVLYLLASDHYVNQEKTGEWRFAFGLVSRWWRISRGLPQ